MKFTLLPGQLCGIIGYWLFYAVPEMNALIRPPKDSGCATAINNYGCYCPQSSGQRRNPQKCNDMFDEELMDSKSGFPSPAILTQPTLNPHLNPIDLTPGNICKIDKYCEIKVSPMDQDWKIIDWCITTESSNLYHLQLLGPPHSPVCCDSANDQKYTMMCMRRDLSLQLFLNSPLLISLYIKLLPRTAINFRLSLVLLDSTSVSNVIPAEFTNKKNSGGAKVKLLKIENLVLDLSTVKKWEDL